VSLTVVSSRRVLGAPGCSSDARRGGWRCRLFKPLTGEGLNPTHHPLFPPDGGRLSIVTLVAGLDEYEFNLMRWARDRIAAGEIETVWRQLQRVRGIATKIAAFYLRDVITAHELDETALRAVCFQPIDVWTRRGAQALASLIDRGAPADSDDAGAAAVLVEIATRAKVRPSVLIAGLWVLGSAVLGSNLSFAEVLTDEAALRSAAETARTRLLAQRARTEGLIELAGALSEPAR
jgi:hypothetical protein